MSFIQPCFIRKNTTELRKKLKKFGYKFSGADHIELDCIVTFPHHDTFSVFAAHRFNIYDDSFNTIWKGYIDCGTNEELFLALAALRDDSDYMQWFIFPKTQTKRMPGCFGQVVGMDGHYQEIIEHEWIQYNMDNRKLSEKIESVLSLCCCDEEKKFIPHKATVEEIIEHLKNK